MELTQHGFNRAGVPLFHVDFERDGWIWRVDELMTRDEAENERDLGWQVPATRIELAPEPERAFDPMVDYGVRDLDLL